MKDYKIVYVDEQEKSIRNFQRKFGEHFDVIGMLPLADMEELIVDIFKSGATAIVTDFNLAEYKSDIKYPVPYDGVQLVEAILAIRHGFPSFVLTSYDVAAVQKTKDVNLIYPKDVLNGKIGNITLQDKVNIQIKHYLAEMEKNSRAFHVLLEKRNAGNITEQEENQLLELDTLLEKSLNKKRAVSSSAKDNLGIKKLNALLQGTEALIKELRKEHAK